MKHNDTRPVPKARAELVASLEQSITVICAGWGTLTTVSLGAYLCFVPMSAILAREGYDADFLLVVPGAPFIFAAPFVIARLGVAHARWFLRRRLSALTAAVAKKHGASVAELEPVVRDDVNALLRYSRATGAP